MGSYKIEWKRSAARELRKLPREAVSRILQAVEELSANPYPTGVRKLVGSEQTYRIRVGDYRVVYSVFSSTLIIQIIRVGHRKDVYNREPVPRQESYRGKVTVMIHNVPSHEDKEAFRHSAGGWKGTVNAETLIKNIYANRLVSTRPAPRFK